MTENPADNSTADENDVSQNAVADELSKKKNVKVARQLQRGGDIIVGTVVGTLGSIGAVYAGRRFAPKKMEAVERGMFALDRRFDKLRNWFGGGIKKEHVSEYDKKHVQSQADWAAMLAAGYVSNTSAQMWRRSSEKREDEKVHDKWLWRLGGVSCGWLGGAVGCWVAAEGADRYLSSSSPYHIAPVKDNVTAWLDRRINNVLLKDSHAKPVRVYADKSTPKAHLKAKRLSTLLFDNAVMIIGAIPTNLITQAAYDAAVGKKGDKSADEKMAV